MAIKHNLLNFFVKLRNSFNVDNYISATAKASKTTTQMSRIPSASLTLLIGKYQKLDEDSVQGVLLKSLDNYIKWCDYLNIQPVWSSVGIPHKEAEVACCNEVHSLAMSSEKIRIAYEKECMQLRKHDVKGDDPSAVDKMRIATRDLHTQIKVSIHSIEAILSRIKTLRDQELQPQLLELIQGLARMWKVMAECQQTQKRTSDEAKLLLCACTNWLMELKKKAKAADIAKSQVLDTDLAQLLRLAAEEGWLNIGSYQYKSF